jgi:hypothetical protein
VENIKKQHSSITISSSSNIREQEERKESLEVKWNHIRERSKEKKRREWNL